MSDLPDGFVLVEPKRGGRACNNRPEVVVYENHIQLFGDLRREADPRVDVAIRSGNQFALRFNDDGVYKVLRPGQWKSQAVNPRGMIEPGRYTGVKQGDWWIMSPVETGLIDE